MAKNIWCVNLKATKTTAQFCIDQGLVGIGWGIDPAPASREEYFKQGKAKYYATEKGKSWKTAANAIVDRMKIHDLVWTRTPNAEYYLGRIISEWRPENGDEFRAVDTRNVRNCEWMGIGGVEEVPGRVLNNFRRGRSAQRVLGEQVNLYSRFLFNKNMGESIYPIETDSKKDIFDLLAPDDFEDAVGIYLQCKKKLIVYPSTCKQDTKHIEFVLSSLDGKERFGVQVKSGIKSDKAKLNYDTYQKGTNKVFLFAADGKIKGEPNEKTEAISPDVIRTFIYDHRQLMPPRIQTWIEYVESS